MRKKLMTLSLAGSLAVGGATVAMADPPMDNPAEHPALYGLCTAYFANGGNGNSHDAPPFAALEDAADEAGDNNGTTTPAEMESFCEAVRPSNGTGGGGADDSSAPSPTEPRGNNRP
jgi:hypothetical protein